MSLCAHHNAKLLEFVHELNIGALRNFECVIFVLRRRFYIIEHLLLLKAFASPCCRRPTCRLLLEAAAPSCTIVAELNGLAKKH